MCRCVLAFFYFRERKSVREIKKERKREKKRAKEREKKKERKRNVQVNKGAASLWRKRQIANRCLIPNAAANYTQSKQS